MSYDTFKWSVSYYLLLYNYYTAIRGALVSFCKEQPKPGQFPVEGYIII